MINYAVYLQVGGKGKKSVTGKQMRKRKRFDVSSGLEEGSKSSVRMLLNLLASRLLLVFLLWATFLFYVRFASSGNSTQFLKKKIV